MNKKELVSRVKESMGCTRKEAEASVSAVLDSVVDGLVVDGKVALVGFGTFSVVDRAARTCRNPQTGDAIDVPAKKAPKFKPSAALKSAVNMFVDDEDEAEAEVEDGEGEAEAEDNE